jgi:peptidyl-prolyl cis-trans isomerase SurA
LKKFLTLLICCFSLFTSKAQNIFTYGNKIVTKQEFLNSFKKNNLDASDKKIALENYLNLFIRFKLKVQAAYDLKMDTLSSLKTELHAYQKQIQPSYMMDQDTLNKLVAEAHKRMQQDVEVKHIFIAYRKDTNNNADGPISENEKNIAGIKSTEISTKIKQGEDFERLAINYSDDVEVNRNRGYLGFITAFTLPYAFENEIYALKDGETSKAIKSENGFHFFKKMSSREALGKMHAAQILISAPENATNEEMRSRKLLSDEIHSLLSKGADFDSLALIYSDDVSAANNGGIMQDIEVGKFDQIFEINVFRLKKDNEISVVFRTDYGFHIVKRLSAIPVEKDYKLAETSIKDKILLDNRRDIAANAFKQKATALAQSKGINTKEKNFIENHLAELNPLYAEQIKEFKEGNLLFEIMEKKIWSKSTNDIAGLKQFYQLNKNKYFWKESVQALIITLPEKETAEKIRNEYLKDSSVDKIKKYYSEIALIDTGRFEASELVGVGSSNAQAGYVSAIAKNESDESSTFVIVLKKYNDPSIKSFDQSKSFLINDYQQQLENNWIDSLKKRYPIVINQQTVKAILQEMN